MLKAQIFLLIIGLIGYAATMPAAPVKSGDKVVYQQLPAHRDTSTAVLKDTVHVVGTITTRIKNTYRDSTFLVRSDTTRTSKFDTLQIPRKVK